MLAPSECWSEPHTILWNQGGYGGGLQLGKQELALENLKAWESKLSNQRKVDLIRYEKFLPGKIMPYDRYHKMPATINVSTLLGSYMLQNVGSSILPAMKCQLPTINVRYISYSRNTWNCQVLKWQNCTTNQGCSNWILVLWSVAYNYEFCHYHYIQLPWLLASRDYNYQKITLQITLVNHRSKLSEIACSCHVWWLEAGVWVGQVV